MYDAPTRRSFGREARPVRAEELGGEFPVSVRPCRSEDLPPIDAILQESPEAAAWTAEALGDAFARHLKYFFTGWRGGEIAGFISGRQVLEEGEILNLGVRKADRRRGVGLAMLQVLLEVFRQRNVLQVFLEVRESNAPAIEFYGKAGFQKIGKRPGYYQNPDEAALLLAMKLEGRNSGSPAGAGGGGCGGW
jgi:ribosomal-protein-alanine N-acetyltransferase